VPGAAPQVSNKNVFMFSRFILVVLQPQLNAALHQGPVYGQPVHKAYLEAQNPYFGSSKSDTLIRPNSNN
jgi:hypothetical protein